MSAHTKPRVLLTPLTQGASGQAPIELDGPRSWFVVLGSFCALVCTFGAVSSYGVFQAYYTSTMLSHYSPSQVSWIGAIQYFLLLFLGLPVGLLTDRGYTRHLVFSGTFIVVISQLSVSWCTQYWELLTVQGLIYGTGCGCLFTTSTATIQPWFDQQRGLALGVVACGAAVGGVVCSLVTATLLPKIGFAWTARALALIFLLLLSLGCVLQLIRPYPSVEVQPRITHPAHEMSVISRLKYEFPAVFTVAFACYVSALFCAAAGVYLPFNYMQQYGQYVVLADSHTKYLTAYVNAASILGRLGGGFLADRIGPLKCISPALATCSLLCFIWTLCATNTTIQLYAVLFGIPQGVYIALVPAGAHAVASKGLGRSLGLGFTIQSFAALMSPPIFGALITDRRGGKAYLGASVFGGCILCISSVLVGAVIVILKRQSRINAPGRNTLEQSVVREEMDASDDH